MVPFNVTQMIANMHPSWLEVLGSELEKPYMQTLKAFLQQEAQTGKTIYPPSTEVFAAFNQTPFNRVKVVIIGQDPYHGPSQAHGLCFSVNKGVPVPPSLKNIYKELASDIGFHIPDHGNLSSWAQQGVLLLNATLTVRAGEAGSHQKKGWETFTDMAIQRLCEQRRNLVFMLWGNYARSKRHFMHNQKVLESAHPSPLSAYNGFLGCRHFSQANAFLVEKGLTPIDWQIT